MTVTQLVELALDSDSPLDRQHAAFADLVARFEAMAFAHALRLLADADEARDATQDAFLTAWLKLRTLEEPAAFGAWLKRLIATQCSRRRRNGKLQPLIDSSAVDRSAVDRDFDRREQRRLLARAMIGLNASEHRILVLFYFLGRGLHEIAALMRIPRATVGKRLYTARLKMRRALPASLRQQFLTLRPAGDFARQIRQGVFDQYVGVYRFDRRPELTVQIRREGDRLVSYGAGQRNVLASIDDSTLMTTAYDGEGRFLRDRSGRVRQFVYYEFGTRLGKATKV